MEVTSVISDWYAMRQRCWGPLRITIAGPGVLDIVCHHTPPAFVVHVLCVPAVLTDAVGGVTLVQDEMPKQFRRVVGECRGEILLFL